MTEDKIISDYELAFLLTSGEAFLGLADVLKNHGAEITYESPINQIKLAYTIKKQTSAFFGFCNFRAPKDAVKKVNDDLSFIPALVRFLIITPPLKPAAREPRPERPYEPRTEKPVPALSNEALEEKLEEILK